MRITTEPLKLLTVVILGTYMRRWPMHAIHFELCKLLMKMRHGIWEMNSMSIFWIRYPCHSVLCVYFIQMYENRIIYDVLSTTIFLRFQDIFTVALMRDEQRSSMFARIRDSYKWKTGSCRAFDWKEMKQMMQWDTKYVVWFIKRVDSPKRKFKCCFVGQNTTHDI